MAHRRAWETESELASDDEELAAQREWELQDEGEAGGGSDRESGSSVEGEEVADDDVDPAKAFLEMLTDLYLVDCLSAHAFCMMCYFAHRGGMSHSVGAFGLPPGKNTGAYQRFLNSKFGWSKRDGSTYKLPLVTRAKGSAKRTETVIATQPLQEAVQEELEDDPSILVLLDEAIADDALPKSSWCLQARAINNF